MSRYMIATKAVHILGDISRDEPDLAIIDGEDGDDYIGEWVTGIGYVNVRFPKATTRELNEHERAHYRRKFVTGPWGSWQIDPDEPPQKATDARTTPGEGDGTGSGPVEAHGAAEGSAVDAAIETARDALVAATDPTREGDGCLTDERACFVAHPIHFAWYQAGQTGVLGEASRIAAAAVRAAEPILRQAVAEEIARALEAKAAGPLGPGAMVEFNVLREAAEIAREVGRGK